VPSHEEAALLRRIQGELSPEERQRYRTLIDRREARVISPEELQDLIRLSDQAERFDADRVSALIELARLRQTTLDQVRAEFDVGPSSESAHE
jgi:hypothetical protein